MRTPISFRLSLPLCVAFFCIPTQAQTTPDGSVRTRIEGIEIPTIKGAPFAAKVEVTWQQPLIGGGTVSRTYYTMVARDSQGRVHRETRDFVPANSGAEPRLRSIGVYDPVAGMHSVCSQDTMTCTITDFQPRQAISVAASTTPASSGNTRRMSLGDQTMDSLHVVGTRETVSSMAGENGNSRVVVSNREFWFSPDLQMNLSVTRTNPQLGQVTLIVTNLVRSEPDPSWFATPAGFQVKDVRGK